MSETRRMLLDFQTEEVGKRARSTKKVRNALVKAISDTSDIVRQRALIATMDLADPTIVTDVVKALKDDEEEVRITAAEVLAWYQQPSTIPNFLEGLKDSSTWVRSHCANGLSKLVSGPIWARIPVTKIDTIIADFPDMDEEKVRLFLTEIKVRPDQIDRFLRWRKSNFEVDIDTTIIEEMESGPIILEGAELEPASTLAKPTGISGEVEEILSELPEEILATLPEEDLKRLTPKTARELVDSLLESLADTEEKKPKKKKTVRVRKVKKVKKKDGLTKEDLLEQIPDEVKDSLPEDVLKDLSVEELEAVVASSSESGATITEEPSEPLEEPDKKEPKKKTKDSVDDDRLSALTEKYGEEKAEILINVPEEMLAGIPDDQISEMDLDSLKDLADALEPR